MRDDRADTIRDALKRGGKREGYTVSSIASTRFGPIPDPVGECRPFVKYDEQEAIDALDGLAARCAVAEQFVEDVRGWAEVAATTSDHPLLELLAEYDAGTKS